MGAFTREQAATLAPLLEAIIAGLTKTNVRLAAIQKVLFEKGTISSGEYHAAIQEAEAGMAVEKAFRPELEDIAEKLRRLLEGAQ
jgi:hypothetical protein